MFTSDDYLYGWLLYISGGLVFMGCWWWLTAKIRFADIRLLLRVIAGVIMFVPWYVSPDMDYLAPAIIMVGMEGLFEGPGAFWRAGTPLLVVLALAVVACLIYSLVRFLLRRRSKPETAEAA